MTLNVHRRAERIPVDRHSDLEADLGIPERARASVLFAHGSGSSRRSPRNRNVAAALNGAGFATVLVDLLTADEERRDAATRKLRFDIGLLAARLSAVTDWVSDGDELGSLPVFLYGASTGAAAALRTAADRPAVRGVVSRGGRPDLAGDALGAVHVPVLLIVGGNDREVLALNRRAAATLRAASPSVEVTVVPGATHLFEEPGALDAVVALTVAALDRWSAQSRAPG